MSMWRGVKARRSVGTALAVVALGFSLTACGSSGEDGKEPASGAPSTAPKEETPKEEGTDGPTVPDTTTTLATINGSNGFQFVVNTAARDEGGFLTVTGSIKNTTSKQIYAPTQWSGQETQVKRTGPSLGGTTLVDKGQKKRYYVLRDTDGFPLTTTGITGVKAGESVSFYAQFPAPPEGTSEVDLQVPLMPTATIAIS
ncbi:hypothetical protein [Streptomyces liangshanensis]|uniref:Secreted protein n=1 Tax=Streptomyces liangshanensis TaxID=2717324 RepID=A0A6G9GXG9_9ACTN|nr:hypothetical protein [Streptomyces liangshanensis]QIQ02914.1 hypothetical protein HA039_11760 [Streptomyces liangshanensis]